MDRGNPSGINRRQLLWGGAASVLAATSGALPALALPPDEPPSGEPFPAYHWACQFLEDLSRFSFETGRPPETFLMEKPVTRADCAWAVRAIFAQVPYLQAAALASDDSIVTPATEWPG